MAKIDTFSDSFASASLNTGNWTQFTAGSATMSYSAAGAVVTPPGTTSSSTDGDITSVGSYDLTSSAAYLHIISAFTSAHGDSTLSLRSAGSSSNALRWQVENGQIFTQKVISGTLTNLANMTYSTTTHAYVRIRENGVGTIIWSYSSNGSSWTDLASLPAPFSITAMTVNISGTFFGADTSAGTYQFNKFNTLNISTGQGSSSSQVHPGAGPSSRGRFMLSPRSTTVTPVSPPNSSGNFFLFF